MSAHGRARVAVPVTADVVLSTAMNVAPTLVGFATGTAGALTPRLGARGGAGVAVRVTADVVLSTAMNVAPAATPPSSMPDAVTADDSSRAARTTWPRVRPVTRASAN